MYLQAQTDFDRIAEAIDFIKNNYQLQPSLETIAKHVNISPSHFQKMFIEWAGVSPKKMLQFITVNYAKSILKNEPTSLFNTSIKTGLSSPSRLHDLFISIEAMTPGEYKNGGVNLAISYAFATTIFGNIIIAATAKGICHIAFYDDKNIALQNLIKAFPNATFTLNENNFHQNIVQVFKNEFKEKIKLHLYGTNFQLKVWQALLTIPMSKLSTYGDIANTIQSPKAARAVGTAIGNNPVAFLIPCHRVIQATGIFGGYMWGPKRKTAIIGWEAAQAQL
jgi:AraC family transcriptional regulator, regulatory protein of adaptative response / methylated-DNA-[protein]-cysteine methyltransferase